MGLFFGATLEGWSSNVTSWLRRETRHALSSNLAKRSRTPAIPTNSKSSERQSDIPMDQGSYSRRTLVHYPDAMLANFHVQQKINHAQHSTRALILKHASCEQLTRTDASFACNYWVNGNFCMIDRVRFTDPSRVASEVCVTPILHSIADSCFTEPQQISGA